MQCHFDSNCITLYMYNFCMTEQEKKGSVGVKFTIKGRRFIKGKLDLPFRPYYLTKRRHLKMRVSALLSYERSTKTLIYFSHLALFCKINVLISRNIFCVIQFLKFLLSLSSNWPDPIPFGVVSYTFNVKSLSHLSLNLGVLKLKFTLRAACTWSFRNLAITLDPWWPQ